MPRQMAVADANPQWSNIVILGLKKFSQIKFQGQCTAHGTKVQNTEKLRTRKNNRSIPYAGAGVPRLEGLFSACPGLSADVAVTLSFTT